MSLLICSGFGNSATDADRIQRATKAPRSTARSTPSRRRLVRREKSVTDPGSDVNLEADDGI